MLEPEQQINNVFDACYVPRDIALTGLRMKATVIDASEKALDEDSGEWKRR